MSDRYVALLRGINVGGKNLIRMADLRGAFEDMGFEGVATYIQSGNVLFGSVGAPEAHSIEAALTERFGIALKVVLRSAADLRRVVAEAPEGFGAATHRCDLIFVRPPLTAERALAVAELRDGIDQAWAGPGVVYFARLAARASGSRLSRIVATPEYQDMTIRNWRTTTKLDELLSATA